MAGNKANTKTKGKEDKSKIGKGAIQNAEDSEDLIDFSVLRRPVPTSITGFAQARKIFDLATEELKDLLTKECDILYECKVCRNIFRSLANFISHKRVYCKEKFNSSTHGHFINGNSVTNEMQKIRNTEEGYQEFLKTKNITETINNVDDTDEQIPLSKDLTTVYENIMKTKGVYESNQDPNMILKKIPSSSIAVFQTVSFEDKQSENMRTEVQELDRIMCRNRAVLQDDGNFIIESSKESKETENVIQISDDDDNDDADILKCKICDLQFSTQKTLRFHMKYKHLESRLVYPCPDCLEIFSTSWSVYRHLFKVHRKTAAQVRRLRESIQAKAFRMNNPPASYERRRNRPPPPQPQPLTEEERRDQENQAWMDNMESLGSVPRCGGCGRTFERRAALAAHAATCQPRARALASHGPAPAAAPAPAPASASASASAPLAAPACARTLPRPDAKKIEIQIRKDYNKGPSGLTILKPPEMLEGKLSCQKVQHASKTVKQIRKKEDDNEEEAAVDDANGADGADGPDGADGAEGPEGAQGEESADEAPMDLEEDERSSASGSPRPRRPAPAPADQPQPGIKLPFALQAEKSNLAAFRQRIACDSDFNKLLCKKCDTKLDTALQLYDHMAAHVKWVRYACKLCNYKNYSFEKLPEHVKIVHKLKGDSDFYYSTVKAIDGKEAMMMSTCFSDTDIKEEESNDANDISPESRRPSRCSSDSSRLSDESTSSNNVVGRKRKVYQNKGVSKKKKDSNDYGDDQRDRESSSDKLLKVIGESHLTNVKAFEENSSDIEEIEEKITKRHSTEDIPMSMHSRRPIRKRTKVKNADFEYDLSNLLKMEAQGYRETVPGSKIAPTASTSGKVTPTATSKPSQPKKKSHSDTIKSNVLETYNKECVGALTTLSKKAVENAIAHMRTAKFAVYSAEPRNTIFARPILPRILSRGDKTAAKNLSDELKDSPIPNKVTKVTIMPPFKDILMNGQEQSEKDSPMPKDDFKIMLKKAVPEKSDNHAQVSSDLDGLSDVTSTALSAVEQNDSDDIKMEKVDTNLSIPAVVPVQFRRESLEVMKNPLINKNISDLSRAGMKTKILVIKPINRKSDVGRSVNTPLKFQTIKLKDPTKVSTEDNSSDHIMVVQVPEVPCTNASEMKMVAMTPVNSNSLPNTSNYSDIEKPDAIEDKLETTDVEIHNAVTKHIEKDLNENNEIEETSSSEKEPADYSIDVDTDTKNNR